MGKLSAKKAAGLELESSLADDRSAATGALGDSSYLATGGEDDLASSLSGGSAGRAKAAAAVTAGEPLDIMIVGDSLSVDPSPFIGGGSSFGALLEDALAGKGKDVDITALSTIGHRTDQGLADLQAYFDNGGTAPDAVIVALGTNDALQQVGLNSVSDNLDSILSLLDSQGVDAVLVSGAYGSYPSHGGDGYTDKKEIKAFEKIFKTEASQADALYNKYFLGDVLKNAGLYTDDGLHPNELGADRQVSKFLKSALALVKEAQADITAAAKASAAESSHASLSSLVHDGSDHAQA